MNNKLTFQQKELLRLAVSFLRSNIPDVEEAMDITINEQEVDELEEILYKNKLLGD